MTITLSQQAFWELFEEALEHPHPFPLDSNEAVYDYPAELGLGWWRDVLLRQGIDLAIAHYHHHSDFVLHLPERSHPLEFILTFETAPTANFQNIKRGRYELFGAGMAPREVVEHQAASSNIDINVYIDPAVFQAWWGNGSELSALSLKTLFRPF